MKRVPIRTCAACRSTRPKRELIRLVRTSSGEVEIDLSAKKAGRGTYLCREQTCWEKALKGAGLERALRCRLTRDNRERLVEAGQQLIKESTSAQGQ